MEAPCGTSRKLFGTDARRDSTVPVCSTFPGTPGDSTGTVRVVQTDEACVCQRGSVPVPGCQHHSAHRWVCRCRGAMGPVSGDRGGRMRLPCVEVLVCGGA
jgi:hypothetical protein